mmetsp:Transcript_67295/g.210469  ORF Transcript_67295/g.210469 Transcript_67295/m.210469 type:complete len:301 (+) Transcript_67295:965-1867(+)
MLLRRTGYLCQSGRRDPHPDRDIFCEHGEQDRGHCAVAGQGVADSEPRQGHYQCQLCGHGHQARHKAGGEDDDSQPGELGPSVFCHLPCLWLFAEPLEHVPGEAEEGLHRRHLNLPDRDHYAGVGLLTCEGDPGPSHAVPSGDHHWGHAPLRRDLQGGRLQPPVQPRRADLLATAAPLLHLFPGMRRGVPGALRPGRQVRLPPQVHKQGGRHRGRRGYLLPVHRHLCDGAPEHRPSLSDHRLVQLLQTIPHDRLPLPALDGHQQLGCGDRGASSARGRLRCLRSVSGCHDVASSLLHDST